MPLSCSVAIEMKAVLDVNLVGLMIMMCLMMSLALWSNKVKVNTKAKIHWYFPIRMQKKVVKFSLASQAVFVKMTKVALMRTRKRTNLRKTGAYANWYFGSKTTQMKDL